MAYTTREVSRSPAPMHRLPCRSSGKRISKQMRRLGLGSVRAPLPLRLLHSREVQRVLALRRAYRTSAITTPALTVRRIHIGTSAGAGRSRSSSTFPHRLPDPGVERRGVRALELRIVGVQREEPPTKVATM
jgi:hypothetical protein